METERDSSAVAETETVFDFEDDSSAVCDAEMVSVDDFVKDDESSAVGETDVDLSAVDETVNDFVSDEESSAVPETESERSAVGVNVAE